MCCHSLTGVSFASQVIGFPPTGEVHNSVLATESICLTPKAKALRRQLAAWAIGLANEVEDYVVNEHGNRTYHASQLEGLVAPLLKEIGLEVSGKSTETDN